MGEASECLVQVAGSINTPLQLWSLSHQTYDMLDALPLAYEAAVDAVVLIRRASR